MFTPIRVFAFLAIVGCMSGFTRPAHAQTLSGTAVTLPTTGVSVTRPNRGRNLRNDQINYDDCHLNGAINFSVALANFTGLTLQVWAGNACEVQDNRINPNIANCNQIGQGFSATQINPPAIRVPIKEILYLRTLSSGTSSGNTSSAGTGGTSTNAGNGGTAGEDDSSADRGGTTSSSAGSSSVSTSADAACTDKTSSTAAQNINVYFFLVDVGNNIVGTYVTWKATYKLSAPVPPDKVSIGIGENQLPVRFDYTNATGDNTINGYNLYCDPAPGDDAAKDAGVYPDDGGVIIPACHGSTALIPGARPDPDSQCGRSGPQSKTGNATGLVDGVAYNVALATTDSYENIGVLSKIVCAVPQPITGFFEAYTDAGGKAGGGFCSFSPRREPLPLIAVLGAAACVLLRRRRAA